MLTSPESASTEAPVPADSQLGPGASKPAPSGPDVDALLDHIVRSTHEVVDRLAEKAAPALRRLASPRDSNSGLGILPADGADGLVAGLDDLLARSRNVVTKHPVALIAAAVAAGIVINRIRPR